MVNLFCEGNEEAWGCLMSDLEGKARDPWVRAAMLEFCIRQHEYQRDRMLEAYSQCAPCNGGWGLGGHARDACQGDFFNMNSFH